MDSRSDVCDSNNLKILTGSFQSSSEEDVNEVLVVSHHELVIPSYLIEIELESSVGDILDGILYSELKLVRYTNSDVYQASDLSVNSLVNELNTQIGLNHKAEVEYLTSNAESKFKSIVKQLYFSLESIEMLKKDEGIKFNPNKLDENDTSYNFVLSSFKKGSVANQTKIRRIYQIDQTNKNELDNVDSKFLYLVGMSMEKIVSVLKNGFCDQNSLIDSSGEGEIETDIELMDTDQLEDTDSSGEEDDIELEDNLRHFTTCMEKAISDGINYCVVDNKVKKLSYVLLVGSSEAYESNEDFINDSRNYATRKGFFAVKDTNDYYLLSNITPAYLIVFDVDEK